MAVTCIHAPRLSRSQKSKQEGGADWSAWVTCNALHIDIRKEGKAWWTSFGGEVFSRVLSKELAPLLDASDTGSSLLVTMLARTALHGSLAARQATLCGRTTTSTSLCSVRPLTRTLHSTTIVRLASKTVKDPDHPTGIYFHPLSDAGRYAISLLPKPPSSPSSASIMGYIGDHDSLGQIYKVAVRNPDLVEINQPFLALLHDVMKTEAIPQDGLLEYEAHLRTDGFAHISGEPLWREIAVE